MSLRILILSLFFGVVLGHIEKDLQAPSDQDTSESVSYQAVRPLTHGTAIQAEIDRLESLKDIFPPQNKSYYKPFGDRTIVAMQFPYVPKEALAHLSKSGYEYGTPAKGEHGEPYGPPPKDHYGPPKAEYGVPKPKPPTPPGDLGVIISQHYIYRENVRDYSNIFKPKQERPSDELILELAKAFGENNGKSPNPFNPYYGSSYGAKYHTPQDPTFVMIAIESRLKTNPDAINFGFVGGRSLTNGTIIFPSPKSPSILTTIPFILRNSEDLDHVFDGYEVDAGRLIPKEKTEIKSFLKLMYELHEDIHEDGKEAITRLKRLGDGLKRPRIDMPMGFPDDTVEMKENERRARLTNWLYTSTVGVRTLTQSSASGIYKGTEKGYQQHSPSTSYENTPLKDHFVSYEVPPPSSSNTEHYQTLTLIPS